MTTEYTDYPFTVEGVNFISRVFTHSELAQTIANLPAGIFTQMNSQAVSELIGNPALLTQDELVSELERVNEGGSHAFILLGENN